MPLGDCGRLCLQKNQNFFSIKLLAETASLKRYAYEYKNSKNILHSKLIFSKRTCALQSITAKTEFKSLSFVPRFKEIYNPKDFNKSYCVEV